MYVCPPLPLDRFQALSSLNTIKMSCMDHVFSPVEGGDHAEFQVPVEVIEMDECRVSGKELTQVLSYFPKLSKLSISCCEKIAWIGVVALGTTTTTTSLSRCSSCNGEKGEQTVKHREGQDVIEEEETTISAEGLLLLPPQIQEMRIGRYFESLSCVLLSDDKEATAGGLQGLHSLRSLHILRCPKLLSSYSSSSSTTCFPFPNSLQSLRFVGVQDIKTLLPLTNLNSLTELEIGECEDLIGVGLWHLLAQGHLTKLSVKETPKFFLGSDPPQELPSHPLQELRTDDVAGFLDPPICALLSSSIIKLVISSDKDIERFTKEQEEALWLLTSLRELEFWECKRLQCLPSGLHKLPNLKKLLVNGCGAILSPPKEGLPSSVEVWGISRGGALRPRRRGYFHSLQK
ncbi:hypothetical protein PR202_gb14302 [Eleusine coracana subsp. coracana]|uniref:Disease resistance protein n=1 Tax=Eleusine coracana subsp. coracana TaxID=191504 RepID=A0AAV5EV10_ELECO|nr:hypothetical protein QOZ80_4BG0334050 [Eleusine coracana subsp. coracana]GJN26376.1 hypothetical protein PR202_gb14302 [Eleusine coracana subsp. coracana]